MTSKSNLVKFAALLILISLIGAACSQGTPEEIVTCSNSYTAGFLRKELKRTVAS